MLVSIQESTEQLTAANNRRVDATSSESNSRNGTKNILNCLNKINKRRQRVSKPIYSYRIQ